MKLSQLAYDKEKELDGVWFECPEGLRLRVARLNNPKYQEFLRKQGAKSRGITTSKISDWTFQAAAKFLLKGWENLQDEKGNDIPFSVSKAEELMKEYSDLYQWVQEFASDREMFRREELDGATKNL